MFLFSEALLAATGDLNTPFIVLGAAQIIAGGVTAGIALAQRFLGELRGVRRGRGRGRAPGEGPEEEEEEEEGEESESVGEDEAVGLREGVGRIVQFLRPPPGGEDPRTRAGSDVSQLKQFYPL